MGGVVHTVISGYGQEFTLVQAGVVTNMWGATYTVADPAGTTSRK
jgi:hypothetical protein